MLQEGIRGLRNDTHRKLMIMYCQGYKMREIALELRMPMGTVQNYIYRSKNKLKAMKAKHFKLFELVCPHVLAKYGERSWMFIDSRLILNLDTIRERIGKPIYVNRGNLTQRGLRCPQCQIVKDKAEAGVLYMSAHTFGKAVDFDVEGMTADEVRTWLAEHGDYLALSDKG